MTKTDRSSQFATRDMSWGAFENWTALIVHRRHANVDAITQQLGRIGVDAVECWPNLPEGADISRFNIVFSMWTWGMTSSFRGSRSKRRCPRSR